MTPEIYFYDKLVKLEYDVLFVIAVSVSDLTRELLAVCSQPAALLSSISSKTATVIIFISIDDESAAAVSVKSLISHCWIV